MLDNKGSIISLKHYKADDVHRALGVMLTPEDNTMKQLDRVKNIAMTFSDNIRMVFIKINDALHVLNNTIIGLSIRPLPLITIIEEECSHIMVPILWDMLPNMQIMRKHDVLYGPVYLQGMGLTHLHILFGTTHCALLIQFYNTDNDLGRFLKQSLECLTMDLVLPKYPFTYNYTNNLQL